MNGKPAWWRWFSTRLGVNTAIVLFNAILIGILWNAVLGLVQTERQDTIRAAIDRNDNLAIAFEQYTIRTIENADAVIEHLIQEYPHNGGKIDLTKWTAAHTIDNKTITLQYFDTLRNMAASPSTKFIFPLEFTSMLGNFVKGQVEQNKDGQS